MELKFRLVSRRNAFRSMAVRHQFHDVAAGALASLWSIPKGTLNIAAATSASQAHRHQSKDRPVPLTAEVSQACSSRTKKASIRATMDKHRADTDKSVPARAMMDISDCVRIHPSSSRSGAQSGTWG